MASYTPNLNLVLPIGVEKVSRAIINSNNTIIDGAIGGINTKITPVSLGASTLAGVKTALINLNSGMTNYTDRAVYFALSSTDGVFTANVPYIGILHRQDANNFSCNVQGKSGQNITLGYDNGTWTIDSPKDEVATLNGKIIKVDFGTITTLDGLKAKITDLHNSIGNNDTRSILFYVSVDGVGSFKRYGNYQGLYSRAANIGTAVVSSQDVDVVSIGYNSAGPTFNFEYLTGKIIKHKEVTVTTTSSGNARIDDQFTGVLVNAWAEDVSLDTSVMSIVNTYNHNNIVRRYVYVMSEFGTAYGEKSVKVHILYI